jgi:hypothetical protein
VKSAEMLAVGWLEVKLPEELEAYRHVMKVAHMVIREAFSNKVVTPGKTTTGRGVVDAPARRRTGARLWFQPSVTIWRKGGNLTTMQGVIQPGDMLHTDFGIVYMGFSTDTQHNAYVLRPGETDAPQGLKDGLKKANRLQDLTMQYARLERTGNDALADALRDREEGGHHPLHLLPRDRLSRPRRRPADWHDRLPGRRARSRRLRVPPQHLALHRAERHPRRARVGRPGVRFALEEDAAIMPDGKWDWVDGRQTEFYLIKPYRLRATGCGLPAGHETHTEVRAAGHR